MSYRFWPCLLVSLLGIAPAQAETLAFPLQGQPLQLAQSPSVTIGPNGVIIRRDDDRDRYRDGTVIATATATAIEIAPARSVMSASSPRRRAWIAVVPMSATPNRAASAAVAAAPAWWVAARSIWIGKRPGGHPPGRYPLFSRSG
ncbi:hypothetical protein [Neorhizobium galegae]|uniref:hypothetical protein n=1 Tax=Neorhizobium galegae TaxID=399 RepID=UPI0021083FD2|nr:hypothetical protein [Neorhizobium galegae]MCQ1834152.1 hypothetical protein [Neorhizobium galegae]UIY30179.1 hypothetical protein LZK73_05665 [Neorhizobium galegae]